MDTQEKYIIFSFAVRPGSCDCDLADGVWAHAMCAISRPGRVHITHALFSFHSTYKGHMLNVGMPQF